jgi:transcriptional regulator with XRE-family HTH domain
MVSVPKTQTFEQFLKTKRIEKDIGLREFARLLGLQPSNYCSIESGSLPAPPEEKLRLIAKILKLNQEQQRLLFDLAAKSRDDIPIDLKRLIKKDAVIPALLRTVEDEKVRTEQIKKIVEDIKSGRYRRPAS